MSLHGIDLAIAPRAVPPSVVAALARDAERAGVRTFWVAEAWREPTVALCAAAQATESIGIGSGVFTIFPRNPVLVAQQAADLQSLSDGRFHLGLGLGVPVVLDRWLGVAYERPVRRMREFVEIVRGVLESAAEGPFAYEGEILRVKSFELHGPEIDEPPPIWVAAVGPQMLRLAARVGDGVMIGGINHREYLTGYALPEITKGRGGGETPAPDSTLAFVPCAAHRDPAVARDAARATLVYIAQHGHYERALAQAGFAEEAERIKATLLGESADVAKRYVSDEMLATLTVSGTPDECLDALARMGDYPARVGISLTPFAGLTEEGAFASHRLLLAAAASARA